MTLHSGFRSDRTELKSRISTETEPQRAEAVAHGYLDELERRSAEPSDAAPDPIRALTTVVLEQVRAGTRVDGLTEAVPRRGRDRHRDRLVLLVVAPAAITALVLVICLVASAPTAAIAVAGGLFAVQLVALQLARSSNSSGGAAAVAANPEAVLDELEGQLLAGDRVLDQARFLLGNRPAAPHEDTAVIDILQDLITPPSTRPEFALARLAELRPQLESRGFEVVDYRRDRADWFEQAPALAARGRETEAGPRTLRPALARDGRLLRPGRVEIPAASRHET